MLVRTVFVLMIGFMNLFASEVSDTLDKIKNTTINIPYYFWEESNNYFLMYRSEDNESSLWRYADGRVWQSLHNAPPYDGFEGQGVFFDKVEYDNGIISIGKLLKKSDNSIISELHSILENKTFEVGYYFWGNSSNGYYLVAEARDKEYSIWEYTKDKRWRAIHNTNKSTTYPVSKKTLADVSLDKKKSTLTIGNILTKDNGSLYLTFNDKNHQKEKILGLKYWDKYPDMSWSMNPNSHKNIKHFVLIAKTSTNEFIWGKVLDKNTFGTNEFNSIMPFAFNKCDKNYKMPKTNKPTSKITFQLYTIKSSDILAKDNCFELLKEAKHKSNELIVSINKPIISYKSNLFRERKDNVGIIESALIISSIGHTIKEPIKQSSLSILNLPKGLVAKIEAHKNGLKISLTGEAIKHNKNVDLEISLESSIWDKKVPTQKLSAKIIFINPKTNLDVEVLTKEPYYKYQWTHKETTALAGYGVYPNSHASIESAWEISQGEGVIVGIIDTNFDTSHIELSDNIISSLNVETNSPDVKSKSLTSSHGTLVAGLIIAPINGQGIIGVAPKSKAIVSTFRFGMTKTSKIISALEYMKKSKVNVLNNSWGSNNVVEAVSSKIKDLYNSGITVVFSSGNDNQNLDAEINDESELPFVIGVGSSSEQNTRSSYSNYGSALDVLAPGGYRLGVLTTDREDGYGKNLTHGLVNTGYSFAHGTSFSAPIVSGVVALMISVNPSLTPDNILKILTETADKIEGDTSFNVYNGHGKINARKALEKAKDFK